MAETVTIAGQQYKKRQPLGVLGLSIITIGIYFFYWFYKVNQEIKQFTGDQSISPGRSLLALIPGFLLIVPPYIAYYNTANHIMKMEQQRGVTSQISPALVVVIGIVFAFAVPPYGQEHLNRVWDAASMTPASGSAPAPPPPPPG